jgi:predicted transcriptional regulator
MYSAGIAYLLWLFSGFGALGFHRFYLRKYCTGIIWMCTGGFFFLGALYDFFTLKRQVEEANWRLGARPWGSGAGNPEYASYQNGPAKRDSPERVILRLAKTNKGVVTTSDLALEANIPIEEAKKALEDLLAKGFVELEVTKTGALVYTVPDMAGDRPSSFEP